MTVPRTPDVTRTKAEWAAIDRAWREFDRSTAYFCRLRGDTFDLPVCQTAWDRYKVLLGGNVPTPGGLQ